MIKSRLVLSKLTKFRLSNHNLTIEKGRHLRIPVKERLCPFGCKDIEDEFHLLQIALLMKP
jgi:hypothetical protein